MACGRKRLGFCPARHPAPADLLQYADVDSRTVARPSWHACTDVERSGCRASEMGAPPDRGSLSQVEFSDFLHTTNRPALGQSGPPPASWPGRRVPREALDVAAEGCTQTGLPSVAPVGAGPRGSEPLGGLPWYGGSVMQVHYGELPLICTASGGHQREPETLAPCVAVEGRCLPVRRRSLADGRVGVRFEYLEVYGGGHALVSGHGVELNLASLADGRVVDARFHAVGPRQ